MLSRALTTVKKYPKNGVNHGTSLANKYEEDSNTSGWFMDDLPITFCTDNNNNNNNINSICGSTLTSREILRSSVGVIGESKLGMTEKVVLLEGKKVYAVKRFKKVVVKKNEFGRRIERLAQISRRCEDYLVPVTAYLYSKRIKFVVSHYFPMASLADLLYGGREQGHTILNWNQRLTIILHIARAISFIHSQSPAIEKNMQMNVHGNIKPSNVMINLDFTARLSDYGFTQLGIRLEEIHDTGQPKPPPLPENRYLDKLCKKCDIYNFGMIVLDMLGGANAPDLRNWIRENIDEIKSGKLHFFEIDLIEGKDREWALKVLNIALECTSKLVDDRPSMDTIMAYLEDDVN